MNRKHRHYATRLQASREIRKKQQAHKDRNDFGKWIEQQRAKGALWTYFKYPLDRIAFCYNLKPCVFDDVKNVYLCGNYASYSETNHAVDEMRLLNSSTIRQDIFASILCLKYGFIKSDFVAMKRLATSLNKNRGLALSQEEHKKWPARPDIFEHCPQPNLNEVSDDDVLEFFLSKDFMDDWSSTSDNSDNDLGRTTDEQIVESEPQVNRRSSIPDVDNCKISLLKHLCPTYGSWGSVENIMKLYGIRRTKTFQVRKVVSDLHRGAIEGTTWLDFEETFDDEILMRTGLQKDKHETIRQDILLYRSAQTSDPVSS